MDKDEMKRLGLTPIEEFITEDHGEEGTPSRMEFESRVDAFILGERLKEERLKAGLTQEQLAERIGTKKSYISRVDAIQDFSWCWQESEFDNPLTFTLFCYLRIYNFFSSSSRVLAKSITKSCSWARMWLQHWATAIPRKLFATMLMTMIS